MKTIEAVNTYMGLRELRSKVFPVKVSFALARNLRILEPVVAVYDETRMKIVLNAGGVTSDNNPGVYTIPEDKTEIVRQELAELEDTDNPGIILNTFKLSDLNSMDLSLEEIDILYPMINEEEG